MDKIKLDVQDAVKKAAAMSALAWLADAGTCWLAGLLEKQLATMALVLMVDD